MLLPFRDIANLKSLWGFESELQTNAMPFHLDSCSSMAATIDRDHQSHNTLQFVSAPIGNTWGATINVEQSATTDIGNSYLFICEVT